MPDEAPVAAPSAAPAAAPAPASPAPSSPSPSPAPAPAAEPFENLGSYDDLDVVEVAGDSVVPSTEPAAGTEAAEPIPPVPPAPPDQPSPAAAKPAQEPAKAQPSAPGQAEPDNSPQGLVKQLEHHRTAVLDALAADRFKLSPEEIRAIDTDAVGAIPHVMARVYYEAMQSTLLHIQNMVPQVVMNMIKVQKQNDDVENAFYGQFKALDRMKHHADVMQFAQMLRGTNPKISQADLFAMIGAAVMAKNGLTAPVANGNGGVPPRPSQPAPFVPATPGATVRVIPEAESPFAGLGRDFDE
jgi:hypothetical protein